MNAMYRTGAGVSLVWVLCTFAASTGAATPADRSAACARFLAENLGQHSMPMTTTSKEAERLFEEGMILSYAFNHDEAARSFRLALREDPRCAMCFWGLAYVHGPNINRPMPPENVPIAYEAAKRAMDLKEGVSERERAYIEALAVRYTPNAVADRSPLDRAYAEAMKQVAARFPQDLDAQNLYAEALMDTSPWNYWGPGGTPTDLTRALLGALERVLAVAPRNIAANHFYIHAVESARPERGVAAADRLGGLVPGAGHLVHMPSHIYIRLGRYHDGSIANERGIRADASYLEKCGTFGFYPMLYVPHNYDFLIATSGFEGRSKLALDTARKLAVLVGGGHGHEGGSTGAMGADAQSFSAAPWLTMVRFGMWNDVLAVAEPAKEQVYARALHAYARAMALLRVGRRDEAEASIRKLETLAADAALDGQLVMGLNAARDILRIGIAEARGEVAAAEGRYEEAIRLLEESVARQDALRYIEPPAWYHSVRLALGAVLLEAGQLRDAERVFREDLARFPKNGWALFGLQESLAQQRRTKESALVSSEFQQAWSRADVVLTAPRF